MKRAFGMIELLFAAVVILLLYFLFFQPNKGAVSPVVNDSQQLHLKKQFAQEQLEDIQNKRLQQQKFQKELNSDY